MAVLLCALGVFQTQAAVVQDNYTSSASQTNFPASTSDLINQGQPTLASAVHSSYTPFTAPPPDTGTTSADAQNDGILGTASTNANTSFDLDGAWASTYNLATNIAPLGYNITNVSVSAGWIHPRASQKFELLYSTVGSPSFISLGTFALDAHTLDGSSLIRITENTTGVIAWHTDAIRFVFSRPAFAANDEAVYREIDVFGQLVPEPSSAALLLLGLGSLLAARRTLRR